MNKNIRNVTISKINNLIPTFTNIKNDLWLKKPTHDSSIVESIAFVCPILPHPCEIEIWNGVVKSLNVNGIIITNESEQSKINEFVEFCKATKTEFLLNIKLLKSIDENKTFLANLENEVQGCSLIVTLGENTLSSYQLLKSRISMQNRLVVWSTSPRPWSLMPIFSEDTEQKNIENTRHKTIRQQVLKMCDLIICPDKDSATWSYLTGVNKERIRRISRGINTNYFSPQTCHKMRTVLRTCLGLDQDNFIFLQLGSLETATGAMDSIYAFKHLLQTHKDLNGKAKLIFCGSGSIGAEIRQQTVNLGLDHDIFFINHKDDQVIKILGNQLCNLMFLCDAVIHNPMIPTNALAGLDSSYDVLCALSSQIHVVSNGNGWIGEWLSRYYTTFANGNIHQQSRIMFESIHSQPKFTRIKNSARTAVCNEFSTEKTQLHITELFQKLLETESPHCEETFDKNYQKIQSFFHSNQYLNAIQLIENTFKLPNLSQPQKAKLMRTIGDCFVKLGDYKSGKENYLYALNFNPNCSKSYLGLGTVALQEQNAKQALHYFQQSVTLDPDYDMSNLGIGLAFESLGDLKKAFQWSRRAAQINHKNTAAIFNVVKLAYALQNYQDAQEVVEKYLTYHPYDTNMIYTLAGLLFKQQSWDKAMSLTNQLLDMEPNNSRAKTLQNQIEQYLPKSQSYGGYPNGRSEDQWTPHTHTAGYQQHKRVGQQT